MTITLDEAKLHLRVDSTEEDTYISGLIDAATAAAADYLGVDLSTDLPTPVRAAILLQVGDLYANREAQGQGTASQYFQNPTYERLLNPYRALSV